jgi:predicted XRE-type DNA-binding protein
MGNIPGKIISSSPKRITRGSGNVFSDLGLPDAKELQTKLALAYTINKIVKESRLTQVKAATVLGVPQPKVSSLKNYKLDGFSVERLMTFLTALDRDVVICVCEPRMRRAAKITVVAE